MLLNNKADRALLHSVLKLCTNRH